MECELCGLKASMKARIEDTVVNVCQKCASFGKIIEEKKAARLIKTIKEKPPEEIKLHPDFAGIVKSSREESGLTREQLAKKLNEKASVIERVERGMRPDSRLAKKLGQALRIKILGYETAAANLPKTKERTVTLGDVVEVKVRKKRH